MGLRNKSWICSEKFQRNNFFFKRDAIIKTTMLDARLIVGSEKVFNHIMNKYTEEFSRKSIIFLKEKNQ